MHTTLFLLFFELVLKVAEFALSLWLERWFVLLLVSCKVEQEAVGLEWPIGFLLRGRQLFGSDEELFGDVCLCEYLIVIRAAPDAVGIQHALDLRFDGPFQALNFAVPFGLVLPVVAIDFGDKGVCHVSRNVGREGVFALEQFR